MPFFGAMPAGPKSVQDGRKDAIIFWSAALVALALRVIAMCWPPNYDYESWNIVADLVVGGKNVYASTDRYNYGPVWMGVVAMLKVASGVHFRLAICLVLSAVDIGIAALLRRHAGLTAAVAFLFAPWSILITGHHGQFDNAAILMGLLSMIYVGTRTGFVEKGLAGLSIRQTVIAAALLGLSLVVKHVLFLFPVWMAFRVPDVRRRALWLAVPFGIFVASFLPFWPEGHAGIIANVLHYPSDSDAPFLNVFGPAIIDTLLGCKPHTRVERYFFYIALMFAGALLRRRSLLELLAFYTACLVIFSSGVWNHYLTIPVLFTALFRNGWSIAYQLLALPFYWLHHDAFKYGEGLAASSPGWKRVWDATELWGHHLFVALLVFSLVQVLWRQQLRSAGARIAQRIGKAMRGSA
jgi:hypothetical protein